MLSIDSKMQPSTKPGNSDRHESLHSSDSDYLPSRSLPPLVRSISARLASVNPFRPKTYYDSPGLLEQSSHWGALVIWTIAAGTTAGLLWAFWGKVDQTVSATGVLEPLTGKVQVKSPSGGIVRRLWVSEGQFVQQGTPLLVVENQGLRARLLAVNKQLALLRYENQLYNILLDGSGRFDINSLPDPPPAIATEEKTRSVRLTVQQTAAQLRQLQARLESQSQTLRLKTSLVNSLKPLYQNGGFAKYNYLSAVDELQQLQSQQIQSKEQITSVLSEAGRQTSSNERQILSLEAEVTGLQEARTNLTINAVQKGRIFNLAVSPGSVISSGAEVMRIVPEGGLRAKIYLPNSDSGFVRPGLPVKLSVSSFPPSEYGYLNATVMRIGADALSGDEGSSSMNSQRANTFPMIVSLGPNPGKEYILSRLAPGMQVGANIIVRQRPVITLLTDVFTKGSEDLKNSR
jgi:hemolysin D